MKLCDIEDIKDFDEKQMLKQIIINVPELLVDPYYKRWKAQIERRCKHFELEKVHMI